MEVLTIHEKLARDLPGMASGEGQVMEHLPANELLCEVWFGTLEDTDDVEAIRLSPTLFGVGSATEVPVGTVFEVTCYDHGHEHSVSTRIKPQEEIDREHAEWAHNIIEWAKGVEP